jgi:hypothetical protein
MARIFYGVKGEGRGFPGCRAECEILPGALDIGNLFDQGL